MYKLHTHLWVPIFKFKLFCTLIDGTRSVENSKRKALNCYLQRRIHKNAIQNQIKYKSFTYKDKSIQTEYIYFYLT